MVVTVAPASAPIGAEQERIARPSISTVQAPHSATPQPNLVPVRPISSRRTHSKRGLRLEVEGIGFAVDGERDHGIAPMIEI